MYAWRSHRIGHLGDGNDRSLLLLGRSRVLLGDLGELHLDGLLGGRAGELGLLDDGRGSSRLRADDDLSRRGLAAKEILNLLSIITRVLLAKSRNLAELLRGNRLDLRGLGVNKLADVVELLVNQLLVAGVNKGNEEDDSGANDGKTPVGNELYEVVGDEGGNKGLRKLVSRQFRKVLVQHTAHEAGMFSAKMMRWASMTKKLINSWTSPIRVSRVSRGTV